MACPTCGCLRLTKVCRHPTMLICVDCGTPRDDRRRPGQRRERLVSAATLCGVAMAGGLLFGLASITELGRSGELELLGEEAEAGGEAGAGEEGGGADLPDGLLGQSLSAGAGGGAAATTPTAAAAQAAAAHPPGHGPAER